MELHTRNEVAAHTDKRNPCEDRIMFDYDKLVQHAIITMRTKDMFMPRCRLRMHQRNNSDVQMNCVNHMCVLCSECLHAPGLLVYAEQHRWACWGMGAVSSQIKLWVGGPIAIQHTRT